MEDQKLLQKQFLEKFGIKTWLHKHKSGYRMEIGQSCADRFYEVIGECPVPSLAYKWK